jgi:hypothetical protein
MTMVLIWVLGSVLAICLAAVAVYGFACEAVARGLDLPWDDDVSMVLSRQVSGTVYQETALERWDREAAAVTVALPRLTC